MLAVDIDQRAIEVKNWNHGPSLPERASAGVALFVVVLSFGYFRDSYVAYRLSCTSRN